ncbi:hypothetical protein LB504_000301 [Fusarium proliferatum]|nr:hypothetical protein LB504_000301 [Fusarium proliferatum]
MRIYLSPTYILCMLLWLDLNRFPLRASPIATLTIASLLLLDSSPPAFFFFNLYPHLRSIHAIILDVQHLRHHLHNSSLLVLVLRKKDIQTAALEPCTTSTLIFSL